MVKNCPTSACTPTAAYAAKGILALPEKSWVGFLVSPEPQRRVKPDRWASRSDKEDRRESNC